MPSRIAMHMAKTSASNCDASARPSSRLEKRAPTPVKEITPTIMPAQAHTAMIWIDMAPASSNAFKIARHPIR